MKEEKKVWNCQKNNLRRKNRIKRGPRSPRLLHDRILARLTRPALFSLVCEAVGGDPDITMPIAISITLISGAIDIHDDIIDQSKTKGDQPTVFGKFGKDIALLVGDALMFKGFTHAIHGRRERNFG